MTGGAAADVEGIAGVGAAVLGLGDDGGVVGIGTADVGDVSDVADVVVAAVLWADDASATGAGPFDEQPATATTAHAARATIRPANPARAARRPRTDDHSSTASPGR